MKKLCVFDLDGTLVDTVADIAAAVNHSLVSMGFPAREKNEYYRMVGNGADVLSRRALPEGAKDRANELFALYKARYIDHCTELSRPYAGMCEALRALLDAGRTLAVITNKPHDQTLRVLGALFDGGLFARVVGQRDGVAKKPAPDSLYEMMDALGFARQNTVYIGDSDVDVLFAKAAGVDCVGAAWGFRGREELEKTGALYTAADPADMARYILGL